MTRNAYHPRRSTIQTINRIKALDGISKVEIIAPHRGTTVTPARIKVTLEQGNSAPGPASTTFTPAEAREWLRKEEDALDNERSQGSC